MRLLQAMAGAHHGGAEAFFVRLGLALHRAGQEQLLLIRDDAERAEALRRGGVEPLQLPFRGFLDIATRLGFRRAIARYRPQLVLTWMNRASALCPRGDFVHVARLGGYYDLKYYRRCDHLIANTRDIAAYLVAQGWPASRVALPAEFRRRDAGGAAAALEPRHARGRSARPGARPAPSQQGLRHAAGGAGAGAATSICGLPARARCARALEGQARALGIASRVRFLGWREDSAALLAAADLLVCPSRHEPLGNVVIEAWAAGRPVLATASEGPRALIRDDETGLLVPIDDAAALGAALRRLAGDAALRARLAEAGRAAYEADYAEARVVSLYRDFFAEVAR